MEEYCHKVMAQKDFSTLETLSVYLVQIHRLAFMEAKHQEAIDLCLDVLKKLGCRLVANRSLMPVQAIISLLQTVKVAQEKSSASFFRTHRTLSDPVQEVFITVLSKPFFACYFADVQFLTVLLICRKVRITLEHGVNDLSGETYGCLAMLVDGIIGDTKTASSFADMAILLQQRSKSKYVMTTTICATACFTYARTKLLQSCLLAVQEGFTIGMHSGNIEFALLCLPGYRIQLPYVMGKSLENVLTRCQACVDQMEELNQTEVSFDAKIFWEMMLNLADQSKETSELKGVIFDAGTYVRDTLIHTAHVHRSRLELLVFYVTLRMLQRLLYRLVTSSKRQPCHIF